MPKVLVIDDEPNVRTLIDLLLSRHGFDVVLADNGRRGLQFITKNTPMLLCLI